MSENFDQFLKIFDVKIPKYIEKDSKLTLYHIEITIKKHTWTVDRSYQEFENFHHSLGQITIQVPNLPSQQIFSLTQNQKDQRRKDLEKFLGFIKYRRDIVVSQLFKDFLQISSKEEFENWDINIVKKAQLKEKHKFPVYDVHYIPDQQILFVLTGSHSIKNKVGGFFSAITKNSKMEAGTLFCYRSIFKNFEFDLMWQHDFNSGPTKMSWDPKLTILAVGQMNGTITCLRVSTEKNYSSYVEFCNIKRHTDQVKDLILNERSAELYSISRDKQLNVTNISKENGAIESKIFPTILNTMVLEKLQDRLYLGGQDGRIYIYQCKVFEKLKALHKIDADGPNNSIVSMSINKKFLLVASVFGYVQVYDLKEPGKEKLMSPISTLRFDTDIRSLAFNYKDREVYANNNNGVVILDSTKGNPIKAIAAHSEQITQIQLIEEESLLITASKDMSVKVYKIRPKLEDDKKLKEQEKLIKKQKKQELENHYRLVEAQQKKADFNDENFYTEQQRLKQRSSSQSSVSSEDSQSSYDSFNDFSENKNKSQQKNTGAIYKKQQIGNDNKKKNVQSILDMQIRQEEIDREQNEMQIKMLEKKLQEVKKRKENKAKRPKLFDEESSGDDEENEIKQKIQDLEKKINKNTQQTKIKNDTNFDKQNVQSSNENQIKNNKKKYNLFGEDEENSQNETNQENQQKKLTKQQKQNPLLITSAKTKTQKNNNNDNFNSNNSLIKNEQKQSLTNTNLPKNSKKVSEKNINQEKNENQNENNKQITNENLNTNQEQNKEKQVQEQSLQEQQQLLYQEENQSELTQNTELNNNNKGENNDNNQYQVKFFEPMQFQSDEKKEQDERQQDYDDFFGGGNSDENQDNNSDKSGSGSGSENEINSQQQQVQSQKQKKIHNFNYSDQPSAQQFLTNFNKKGHESNYYQENKNNFNKQTQKKQEEQTHQESEDEDIGGWDN
ncbi:WD40-repeat-containing domain [Pseudocohnilembus persalinus]|uniref:WD40-repeat-containing domain n=1 Tax=Pseudocohnilembus persalinus TaxID=266149 RepID=A0A0V0QFF0_PSEPJ|nr:WD40-repeat-containing domain [Pseudocohnilembus persalinus]|eukprot:KRX00925.1 WD40-repeat-containing domain [Pseudocohnilembus persalinus]